MNCCKRCENKLTNDFLTLFIHFCMKKNILQIIRTNEFVYKEVLGSEWSPPQEKLLTKEDLPSYQKAKSIIRSS